MNPPEELQVDQSAVSESAVRSPVADDSSSAFAVSAELLQLVVEKSHQWIVVLDAEWNIIWANPAVLSTLPSAASGTAFASLLNEGSSRSLSLVRGESRQFEMELHHPAFGGMQIVSYRFITHENGETLALGYDRSNEREVVAQMAVLIEELEREVNERIRLGEKLEELATTDGLTGVLNRRRFDESLNEEWARWTRYHIPFSLVLIDIDHFKRVNDTHGHLAGDEVLRRLGKTLREVVRTEDTVARYGGEEFAIVAIGASPESAVKLAKRLREGIAATSMPDQVGRVTVSMGIASSACRASSAADVIHQADEALYRAKKNGRDRIEVCR